MLVNALAREITYEMNIAPPAPITVEQVDIAKERLILARATHIDSLVARLQEDRVRRVIEPVLAGTYEGDSSYDDDFAYASDLGLVATDPPSRPANPIYREVITRVLAGAVEKRMTHTSRQFIGDDGRIDMDRMLRSFAAFWRQHGEILTGSLTYHEVAPQLVLMAYLQSIVNGTGFIDREYGIDRGRIDLCLRWPYRDPNGDTKWQREAIELKVWRNKQADPLTDGLGQLDEYVDGLGLDSGVLVIFDRRTRRLDGHKDNADDNERYSRGSNIREVQSRVRTTTGSSEIHGRAPAEIALSQVESPRGRVITLLRL